MTELEKQLLEALKLALSSHGQILLTNPPQEAWQHNRVDEICRAAIAAAEAAPPAAPELYALLYRDNWDGQDDTYHLLAERKNGKWYAEDSGKELLQYEGDAILRVWPLTDTAVGAYATARAIEAAAAGIHLADSSDNLGMLWAVLHWLAPDIAALMEKDKPAAWRLACVRLTATAQEGASRG